MMPARFQPDTRTMAVSGLALLMALVYAALMRGHVVLPGGPPPTWVMAIDLLLVLPLGWLLLKPRAWRSRWPGALAIAGAGLLLGRWLSPADDGLWSWLASLRWLGVALLVAAELWLLSGIVRHVWRDRGQGNAEAVAGQAVQQAFGDGVAGRLMQVEARLWVYALTRRPVTAPFAGSQHFGVHKQHGNASNQQGFVILMAAELPIVHGLLHLAFGASVALVVTAFSLYGWRPVSVDADFLYLRYGLVFDVVVPRLAVLRVEAIDSRAPLQRAPQRLRLQGMGRANVCVRLQPGTHLQLPWGQRLVGEIALGIDEPQAFLHALQPPAAAAQTD